MRGELVRGSSARSTSAGRDSRDAGAFFGQARIVAADVAADLVQRAVVEPWSAALVVVGARRGDDAELGRPALRGIPRVRRIGDEGIERERRLADDAGPLLHGLPVPDLRRGRSGTSLRRCSPRRRAPPTRGGSRARRPPRPPRAGTPPAAAPRAPCRGRSSAPRAPRARSASASRCGRAARRRAPPTRRTRHAAAARRTRPRRRRCGRRSGIPPRRSGARRRRGRSACATEGTASASTSSSASSR